MQTDTAIDTEFEGRHWVVRVGRLYGEPRGTREEARRDYRREAEANTGVEVSLEEYVGFATYRTLARSGHKKALPSRATRPAAPPARVGLLGRALGFVGLLAA
ncbi:hypothetical protein [Azospirillum sp. TSO5]|uniref:hypothetical protein n=1 Tax=Azospirillum sp. TSO5 TaxID=716760 RepID=UPI000D61F899|nr:hypothetical protein [Azospirillum sp. TSO5]PWC92945.1 hypothetical protein TSO5_16080 [Azospirillum sp. TSO5]